MTSGPAVTALVLAGSRRGESDPVARYRRGGAPGPPPPRVRAGSRRGESAPVARYRRVSTKCLATAGGVPLLVRVLRALITCPDVGGVMVSLDDPAILDRVPELSAPPLVGRFTVLVSSASLSQSVADAFGRAGPPLLVTTADHALLDPAMLAHFLEGAERAGA